MLGMIGRRARGLLARESEEDKGEIRNEDAAEGMRRRAPCGCLVDHGKLKVVREEPTS
jgi:hypothetical protein